VCEYTKVPFAFIRAVANAVKANQYTYSILIIINHKSGILNSDWSVMTLISQIFLDNNQKQSALH